MLSSSSFHPLSFSEILLNKEKKYLFVAGVIIAITGDFCKAHFPACNASRCPRDNDVKVYLIGN